MKKLLGIILATGVALGAFAADTAVYSGPFWKTDGFYGDGNEPSASYPKTPEKAPSGHRLSYEIDVPATGWYAPFFKGDPGDQDFFVDDACVAMARTLGKPGADGFAAGPSLWLVKGRRVLRLERLGRRGFPWKKFETMELRRLAPSAASWVFAEKAGHDVVRLGESLRIAVTAGLPDAAADYEIRVAPQNGPDANTWTTLATLSFPKTAKPIRQVAELKLPKEAMYYVKAFVGGKPLPENAFPRFEAIAVDVNDHVLGRRDAHGRARAVGPAGLRRAGDAHRRVRDERLPRGVAKLVPSHEVNAAWNGDQVLWSETGDLSFVLDVPAEGNYTLVLGAVGAAKGEAAVSVNGAADATTSRSRPARRRCSATARIARRRRTAR